MQKNGKSKTFVDKAPKLFLQRFMKQGLAEMEAVVVSFKMASSARMNIFVRTLNFQEYEWKLRVLTKIFILALVGYIFWNGWCHLKADNHSFHKSL